MGIWQKLKEKFSSPKPDDSDDAQFSDEVPTGKTDADSVVVDERLQWIMDNFSGWPSPSYEYVALIEQPDPVVGRKRTLKFFKRPTNEGVVSYPRDFIDKLLDNGE
jgi:hypothetical protein